MGPYSNMSGVATVQKDDHVKRQKEGSHLQARERGFRGNKPCSHLDLGLQPPMIISRLNPLRKKES